MQLVQITCSLVKRLVPQPAQSSGKKRDRKSWRKVFNICAVLGEND